VEELVVIEHVLLLQLVETVVQEVAHVLVLQELVVMETHRL
jgi:hypothetical protein